MNSSRYEEVAATEGSSLSAIDKLILFCLKNKLAVALMIAFFSVWGLMVAPFDWDLGGLPRSPIAVDAIPDIGENQQIVFTEWMGRSPQDVEDQTSYPLTVSLLGIPGVWTIRTFSFFGFSSIYIIFNEDIDFYWSRTRILEKLNSLPSGTLPEGIQPALGPDATSLGQVYWYTLEGRDPDGNPAGGWDLHELLTIPSQKTLAVVLPLALFVIFLILYFQFRSIATSSLVFSGILVAAAGGFILIWFYGQPWFLDFEIFDANMRELFQVHPINLSVAIWVGFLALFGIATENGVVIATFLDQSFAARKPGSIAEIREATVAGAERRIRPCLMTTGTTILALLPVLTSTGRGADIMVPMAIPSFGGMLVVIVTVILVPVLYSSIKEVQFSAGGLSRTPQLQNDS